MKKEFKRALRIHHSLRMKKKAFDKVYGSWYLPSCTEGNAKAVSKAWVSASRVKNNLSVCSCFGCGNPRRYNNGRNRLTLPELRSNDAYEMEFMDRNLK